MRTIVIQAGGASRRMGQDKGLMPFLGQPLVQHVMNRVSSAGDEVLVTTNKPERYGFLGVPLFSDLIPERGALGGLFTALSIASHPLVAVVACDMPFASARLLSAQFELMNSGDFDVVIPRVGGATEPFHAVYRRETCLPAIQQAIEQQKWRADSWFSEVRIHYLSREEILPHDPQLLAFANVNTPDELRQAEQSASENRKNRFSDG